MEANDSHPPRPPVLTPTSSGVVRAAVLALGLVLLATATGASLQAQTVRGVVTRLGVPVAGVVVQLVGSDSAVVARTITDEAGAYRMLAPRSGDYRLTTRRIGFAPTTSATIALTQGQTRLEALTIDGIAVRLETVRVASAKGCLRLDARNSEVSEIWEQAKTALLAAEATLTVRTFSAALLNSRRTAEPGGEQVLQSLALLEVDSVAQPWSSSSVDDLRRTGYVVRGRDDSTAFFAPGLDVLVSNQFASSHCARLVATADSGTIGLSFEPAKPDRRVVELQGVLRVDRATSELRSLDFSYTNLVREVVQAGAGGRLEFAPLRDGSWVIARWQIRMPALAPVRAGAGFRGLSEPPRVASVELVSGDLFVARRGIDTLFSRPLPVVSGTIVDSATGRPLRGARLRLRETGRVAFSDSAGRFDFGAILPGQYTLLTNTLSLDSLGAVSGMGLPVTEMMASIVVRVPNAFRVLPAVCRLSPETRATWRTVGVVRGTVARDTGITDTTAATIVVQWMDSATKTLQTQTTIADESGRYRLCGMPMDTKLDVRADLAAISSAIVTVRLDTVSPFGAADLRLDPLSPSEGMLRGEVVDKAGSPIGNAAIELPQLGLRATTDVKGRYVVPRVPAGRQLVTVRSVGYTPADTTLVIVAGEPMVQRYVLERVTTLKAVNTTASREWARDFDEHKKIGLGQFFTREELAKRENQRLSDLMSMARGTRLMRSGLSAVYLATSRPKNISGAMCYAQVWLDNNPMYLGRDGEPLYNLNERLVMQIEAIEFYAGPSETPAKYNNLNANCGVLVVHTRRD